MKLYCIFSQESIKAMGGNRGKMAAQAGHAFLHSFWDAETKDFPLINDIAKAYRNSGMAKKVTLIVDTTQELYHLAEKYEKISGVSLVRDAGLTVFNQPTVTCLGIGPIKDEDCGEDLQSLKVFI